jgi:hypothetical protein
MNGWFGKLVRPLRKHFRYSPFHDASSGRTERVFLLNLEQFARKCNQRFPALKFNVWHGPVGSAARASGLRSRFGMSLSTGHSECRRPCGIERGSMPFGFKAASDGRRGVGYLSGHVEQRSERVSSGAQSGGMRPQRFLRTLGTGCRGWFEPSNQRSCVVLLHLENGGGRVYEAYLLLMSDAT